MSRTREKEALRGRGASWNPANRFDGRDYVVDDTVPEDYGDGQPDPRTVYLEDSSKTLLMESESPDMGMAVNLNPYRGCEHGCIYCYARPYHEYLGFSAGLDFETKIFVKHNAPGLLRNALSAPRYEPKAISISGITDCYQPCERRFEITRKCLSVLAEFRHPVGIITKSRLVTRDIDLLRELAAHKCVVVFISITTLDLSLNRLLEPRSSSPAQRLEALRMLSEAGIPTGVMVAPVVPGITDHEMPKILEAASAAGAVRAGYIMMRLPHGVAPLFEHWLEQHFPERKEKVLNRIRALREGKLNDPRFGSRMRGVGPWAEQIRAIYRISCQKHGLNQGETGLSADAFRRPGGQQLALF